MRKVWRQEGHLYVGVEGSVKGLVGDWVPVVAGEEDEEEGVIEEAGLVVVVMVAELGLHLLEWDGGVAVYWVWGEDDEEVDTVSIRWFARFLSFCVVSSQS